MLPMKLEAILASGDAVELSDGRLDPDQFLLELSCHVLPPQPKEVVGENAHPVVQPRDQQSPRSVRVQPSFLGLVGERLFDIDDVEVDELLQGLQGQRTVALEAGEAAIGALSRIVKESPEGREEDQLVS
jgi:hypothetical protein